MFEILGWIDSKIQVTRFVLHYSENDAVDQRALGKKWLIMLL